MITTRRGFLAGLIAAPIVVRSGLLMPVKAIVVQPRLIICTERHVSGLSSPLGVFGTLSHAVSDLVQYDPGTGKYYPWWPEKSEVKYSG